MRLEVNFSCFREKYPSRQKDRNERRTWFLIKALTALVLNKMSLWAQIGLKGGINFDYILLPQLSTIIITKFFQIQLGAQMAFFINLTASSLILQSPYPLGFSWSYSCVFSF
jgi:hypothetical protein